MTPLTPRDEFIRASLSYHPDTGVICWRRDAGSGVKAGDVAGFITETGYRRINIMGRNYRAHRLAWLLTYGVWPTRLIDHKNGIRDDDRLQNLREANDSQNCCNCRKRSNNTTGFKGVHFRKSNQKYSAQIRHLHKQHHLGHFKTAEEAHAAYCAAAAKLHKDFARTS